MSKTIEMKANAPTKQRTTLKSGGMPSSLTLQDVTKKTALQEVSGTFKKLFKRFGFGRDVKTVVKFAHASDQGQREYQEDEVYAAESESGAALAILTDGMGGHVAGDVASQIVKDSIRDTMLDKLTRTLDDAELHKALRDAVDTATKNLADHIEQNPDTDGMGSTLIVTVIQDGRLFWVSVGDSPLYLWRSYKCYQINQDHSMAPAIDQMALAGMMTEEEALNHPDRNALTSAMNGSTPEQIDEGNGPVELMPGDIVVLSSDGLQYIPDEKIADVLKKARDSQPLYIAAALLNSVLDIDDPEQDNIGLITLKIEKAKSEKMGNADETEIKDLPDRDANVA